MAPRDSSAPVPAPPHDLHEGELGVPEVARLFELPEHKLRYWSQTGFIRPSVRRGGRVFYSFQDLIAVKVAKGLLDAGLPLQRVRRSLTALKMRLPEIESPLSSLRIRCEDERVLVGATEGTFDAATGQLLLDFEIAALERDVAEVRALPWVDAPTGTEAHAVSTPGAVEPGVRPRTAYDWFARGRELEARWDGRRHDAPELRDAMDAYAQAVELDPDFAAAHTNLGSLYAEIDDLDAARDAFDAALRADPQQPEAQANLAELALRQGDAELAIEGFRQVLRDSPEYAEAHYGLARALLSVGGKAQALAHLERFCGAIERDRHTGAGEGRPLGLVRGEPPPPLPTELERRLGQARRVIDALREQLVDG